MLSSATEMSGVPNPALDHHLQRFDIRSDDGDDTNSDTSETGTVHQLVQEEASFFSLVFADTARRRDAVFTVSRHISKQILSHEFAPALINERERLSFLHLAGINPCTGPL